MLLVYCDLDECGVLLFCFSYWITIVNISQPMVCTEIQQSKGEVASQDLHSNEVVKGS